MVRGHSDDCYDLSLFHLFVQRHSLQHGVSALFDCLVCKVFLPFVRSTMAVCIEWLAFVVCFYFGGHLVGDTPPLPHPLFAPTSCSSFIVGRVRERVTCAYTCVLFAYGSWIDGSVQWLVVVSCLSLVVFVGRWVFLALTLFFNEYSAHPVLWWSHKVVGSTAMG